MRTIENMKNDPNSCFPIYKDKRITISFGKCPSFSCLFVLTLFLSFLKIEGYLNWDWIWILSPVWLCIIVPIFIYLVLVFLWLIGNVLIFIINEVIDYRRKKKLNRF